MARIRTIKPEFFRHEQLAELPALCRLLFIGLWTLADRFGRLEDRPKRIKIEVLPYDSGDVNKMLDALAAAGFIVRYVVGGQRLIAIPSFETHQRFTGKEASTPEYFPAPEIASVGKQQGNNGEAFETQQGNTGDSRNGVWSTEYGVLSVEGADAPTHTPTPAAADGGPDWGASPARKHSANNAYTARRAGLHVPQFLHEALLSQMAVPSEPVLFTWYAETERAYDGRAVGETNLKFWRARFEEWQGATPKGATKPDRFADDGWMPTKLRQATTGGAA
jgi:hypothetical protein